jgi:hypothetical protein
MWLCKRDERGKEGKRGERGRERGMEGGRGKRTNQTVATPYFLLVRTGFVSWVFLRREGWGE